MANTSAIWQQAAHTTYQLSSPRCSTWAIQKAFYQKMLETFLEKSTVGPSAEKLQDRKSKRTKQNEMMALWFHTFWDSKVIIQLNITRKFEHSLWP